MEPTKLDQHGQPVNQRFNLRKNKEKAAYSLRGLLLGLVADRQLNRGELLYLDMWLQHYSDMEDGDVIDLVEQIKLILADGKIEPDELDELMSIIDDIIEYGHEGSNEVEASINELLGFLHGISADEEITENELAELSNWLNSNEQILDTWPANMLADRIDKIYEDGIVTKNELSDLLETVKSLSGHVFEETGMVENAAADILCGDPSGFSHQGKKICFTGKFIYGSRSVIENRAEEMGAHITKNVTKKLDALIIGTLASRDWRFSSHGRKIEKAIDMNQAGSEILILNEERWIGLLRNST